MQTLEHIIIVFLLSQWIDFGCVDLIWCLPIRWFGIAACATVVGSAGIHSRINRFAEHPRDIFMQPSLDHFETAPLRHSNRASHTKWHFACDFNVIQLSDRQYVRCEFITRFIHITEHVRMGFASLALYRSLSERRFTVRCGVFVDTTDYWNKRCVPPSLLRSTISNHGRK